MNLRDPKQVFYEFGNYLLDSENKILFRGEEALSLSPKLFETLYYFVENSGKTLFKEEILENVWSDTFVEESNVAQIIFHLRRILGNGENSDEFIKTMPKRGYCFVAPVKTVFFEQTQKSKLDVLKKENDYQQGGVISEIGIIRDRNKKSRWFGSIGLKARVLLGFVIICVAFIFAYYFWQRNQFAHLSDGSKGKRSIAVLPFKQFKGETDDKQMSIGMADALITKLSNLNNIRVRPTNTIIAAKQSEPLEIGRELGVETVLTGVIQQDNDQIRVTVQLINVSDGSTIWADKFDTSANNIFEVQDNISKQVSNSLISHLNEADNLRIFKRYTNNIEAYKAYSQGRYFWATSSRTDLNKAIEYFEQAIKLDPQYALAYSGLADSYTFLASNYAGTQSAINNQKLAKINALKALELDDSLAEPHTTLAAIIFQEGGNWETTEKEFLKSIELNPNYSVAHNWYSLHLLSQGDFDKAELEMKKALDIDPVSPSIVAALGQIYYFGRRYDLAITQFEKALELDPDFARAKVYLSLALIEVGKKEQALSILENVYQGYPTHTGAKTALGWLFANLDKQMESEEILQQFENNKNPHIFDKYAIALINAELGNTEKAFTILKEISNRKDINMIVRLKFDPRLDILRQDKRFENLFHQ